jgi:ELWxxDGT repeat protein
LTNVNGTLFFRAQDGTHGRELWASNGTAAGTFLVKDISPGASDSYPTYLTNVNGTLFFQANDGTHGVELWESNGSAAGTFLVQDINPVTSSYPNYLTNVNGTLFFGANDGTHGMELWESNGTTAGTFLVQDINPVTSSYPSYLTNVNGTLFFQANDGTHGFGLWESNGTTAGTFLVQASGSSPSRLTNVNGTLFFQASDGTHGFELWASNGTVAGTFLVADISPGAVGSYPSQLANMNGTLFFQANDGTHGIELWESNGSAAGTFMVKDINPGAGNSLSTNPLFAKLTNVNGTLFFSANDSTHGLEVWESNGTGAGTFLVQDINPGGSGSSPSRLTNVDGTLFFRAQDGTHGIELWASNGTTAGTFLVQDINPGPTGSNPTYLTNVSGNLFFAADDGSHGIEPWILRLSTTTISSTPNPSVFGQAVTFTATVSAEPGSGSPSGTVDFKEGATDLTPGGIALSSGQATFATSALPPGHHTITALYSGDSDFNGSQGDDSANPQIVIKDSTAMSLGAGPGAAVFGQPVVFIAFVTAVAPGAGIPAGSVTFKEGSTTLAANVGLSSGQASFSTASLSVGSHTITASYSGSGNFLASGASRAVAVSKAATSTALTSSPNPSVFGQAVIFTATVRAVAPSGGTPTGTVDFEEGATDLTPGGIALAGGRATFLTTSLAVGPHTITAIYGGIANFMGSQANDSAAPQVVNKALSRTVLTSFPDPSVFGQPVPFTVLVSALPLGRGTPMGTILFTDGTTTIGSIALTSGRTTFTTASLSRGNHAINASYSGDTNFTASAYTNYGQPVQKDATTTTVTPSVNPVVVGQVVTLTAAVQASAPGAGTPTGTVTFTDITTVLGTGTLSGSGQATFTTSALAVGTHAIAATYAGDNNFISSVSPILAEVVKSSASVATLGSTSISSTGGTPVPNTVRPLSPQSIDDFFGVAGRKRALAQARLVRRILTPGEYWLEPT